jgi:O-antigen/teichoic acid export membrane protein
VRGFYGPEFAGNRHAISVLACTILASGVSMAAGCGLWALERPDVICKSRILAVCVTLTGSLCLLPPLGMLGTAYALLAGSTLDAAVSYLCYLSVAGAVSKIESSRAFDS